MNQGKISFLAAVLMSVNVIVGVGIYFGPQLMAAKAGSLSFLGWILVGFIVLPLIWCIALAARMFPGPGGFFNYCKVGLGETFGFIATWSYFLGFLSTGATQSTVLKEVLHQELGISWIASYPMVYNFLFVICMALLNLFSITMISKIQSMATVLKLLPLFLVILVLPFYWDSSIVYNFGDFKNVIYTVPMGIFGYWGFESCCNISHMIEGGSTRAFSVILTAFVMSICLYALFHLGLIHIMGTESLIKEGVSAFPEKMGLSSYILRIVKSSFIVLLLLNYANAVYGVLLSNIANLANVAEKRFVFFSDWILRTNSYNRPVGAVLICASIILFYMTCIPKKEIMLALANIGIGTTLLLTVASVFTVQLRNKASITELFLTCLGFVSYAILGFFSWQSIASSNAARLLYTLPIIVGVAAGVTMYKSLTAYKCLDKRG